MRWIRTVTVICALAIAVGSSSVLVGDSPTASGSQKLTADALDTDQTDSVDVQVIPENPRISRTQSAFFVVRIDGIPENRNAVLLGFRSDLGPEDAFYDFDERLVRTVDLPPIFPNFDALVYVRGVDSDGAVYVPVHLSPAEAFAPGSFSVSVHAFSQDFEPSGTGDLELRVLCPTGCRFGMAVEGTIVWFHRNLDLVIGVLGLLIAFFGRKKIWAFIRAPKRYAANSVDDERPREK